jgi:hypothetical protein
VVGHPGQLAVRVDGRRVARAYEWPILQTTDEVS